MRSINPYIVGNPIKDRSSFFGRQDVFREVMQVLRQKDSHAIVLYGQRRIGKTSMLLQLEQRLAQEGEFTPIYFDLQDKASKSLFELLFELAQHISRVTGHTIQRPDDFNRTGDYFRDTFLPGVAEKVASGGLVLLFDEFDVLDSPARTQASQSFFPYLRSWIENVRKIKFIFVIGRRPEELSVRSMAAFKGIQSTRVSFMSEKDTEEVIRQSEKDKSLMWKPDAVARIFDLTHGHPYFTQLLCSVVWENNHEEENNDNCVATGEEVDKAVEQALKMGANAFNWLWDGLPPAERVIMSAMAEVKDEVITQDQLIESLNQSGVRLIARELEIAPETLMDWKLLDHVDKGYIFSVPLLKRWVSLNRPLRRVKDELDRLDPLAENLFQAGQGFYNSNRLADAEQQLRQALNINPNHLKARLLLGRVYLDQSRLTESVEVLEAAYQYDERSARADLLKSLLALADSPSLEDTKQLEVCDKILAIQPDQPLAKEKRLNILARRADAAFEQGEYEQAVKAYEAAGHQAGVEKVREQIWRDGMKQAGALIANRQFTSALESYNKLMVDYPEKAEKVREQSLQDSMSWANSLVTDRQYKEALDIFDRLLVEHPEKLESIKPHRERARAEWRDSRIGDVPYYIGEENWSKVIEICEALLSEFPDDEVIANRLHNARMQLDVARKFNEGVGALENGMQDQARKLFTEIISENPAYGRAALKLVEAIYGKVKISIRVPFGATALTFLTGLFWTILSTFQLSDWANDLFFSRVAENLQDNFSDDLHIHTENYVVIWVILIPLIGVLLGYYGNRILDTTYQVERAKYSYGKSLWIHALFGMGLFYVDRASWRKWLYAVIAALIPALLLMPILYEFLDRYSYYFSSVEVRPIELANGLKIIDMRSNALIALLIAHALSFLDVLWTCRQKQRGRYTSGEKISRPVDIKSLEVVSGQWEPGFDALLTDRPVLIFFGVLILITFLVILLRG